MRGRRGSVERDAREGREGGRGWAYEHKTATDRPKNWNRSSRLAAEGRYVDISIRNEGGEAMTGRRREHVR
eukprot:scaffold85_cov358-Pavlova_lutheri.AAC.37